MLFLEKISRNLVKIGKNIGPPKPETGVSNAFLVVVFYRYTLGPKTGALGNPGRQQKACYDRGGAPLRPTPLPTYVTTEPKRAVFSMETPELLDRGTARYRRDVILVLPYFPFFLHLGHGKVQWVALSLHRKKNSFGVTCTAPHLASLGKNWCLWYAIYVRPGSADILLLFFAYKLSYVLCLPVVRRSMHATPVA